MAGPAFRAAAVRVRVPATSANLGPGFDTLGLALGLYDDVVVRVADAGLHIDIAGEGAETLPRDENHLLVRSLRTAFDLLGGQPRGLEIVCANRIPHGRGLGSSSAAICAGVMAARAVTTGGEARLDDTALLELATEIEGHPDNVAACLLGGFTLAWTDAGAARALRLDPAQSLVPVVFVPAKPLLTKTARGLLPRTVPHVDAAFNAGRAALLVEALTRRPELLLAATEDRLHQEYRAPAMTESADLVNRLRADGVPAVISGAGPTVLALAGNEGEADKVSRLAGEGWTANPLALDTAGASVLPLNAAGGTGTANVGTGAGTGAGRGSGAGRSGGAENDGSAPGGTGSAPR
jgi:homoserine kinase